MAIKETIGAHVYSPENQAVVVIFNVPTVIETDGDGIEHIAYAAKVARRLHKIARSLDAQPQTVVTADYNDSRHDSLDGVGEVER